ncbi:MAG: hypothetical protein Q4P84_04650 [Elusimicrobiales bacterium]|nr:hypothetical protein [Elusimicrobiales bacterium]
MKNYRLGSNTMEHYTSLEELGAAYNCKPFKRKTSDPKKLQDQQERFCSKHICKACGKPMTWISGSIMTCTNSECKGIKIEKTDKDGNIVSTNYITSYNLLDEKGAEIAKNIFT